MKQSALIAGVLLTMLALSHQRAAAQGLSNGDLSKGLDGWVNLAKSGTTFYFSNVRIVKE